MFKKNLITITKRGTAILLAAIIAATSITGCGKSAAMESPSASTSESTRREGRENTAPEACTEAEMTSDAAQASYDSGVNSKEAAAFAPAGGYYDIDESDYDLYYYGNERYEYNEENGFQDVYENPLSTFSADVDTASYSNIRRMIEDGYSLDMIDPAAVRAEEFINYFSYDLNDPKRGDKFGITTEVSTCPWNEDNYLMMVGMKTKDIDLDKMPSQNLVFLLDVSGSMNSEDKLPLLQKSFKQLTRNLSKDDTISIVTYASGVKTVLRGAKGSEKQKIYDALDSLYASGGTNGEGGIQRAYDLAEKYFIKNGNNRVILATDGDLNIGISEPEELEKFISEKKESGVYLSVLGFGTGNIRDDNMEKLADSGNGNYAYIDSIREARKVLVKEMGATLETVAEDVKLQVEFNPENVSEYRLIGYENRTMAARDFNDDTKDAGEIGAGHSVVALYEVVPADSDDGIELKYQKEKYDDIKETKKSGEYSDEFATVSVRYKEPGESDSDLFSILVKTDDFNKKASDSLRFAGAVAEFSMILSRSAYASEITFEDVLDSLKGVEIDDEYKEEFVYLVGEMADRGYDE